MTARVLSAYRAAPHPVSNMLPVETLSEREQQVLALIGRGLANAEIADRLHISEVTVKSHVGHIFTKLGLRDRAAAIVYAFDNGVVEPQA